MNRKVVSIVGLQVFTIAGCADPVKKYDRTARSSKCAPCNRYPATPFTDRFAMQLLFACDGFFYCRKDQLWNCGTKLTKAQAGATLSNIREIRSGYVSKNRHTVQEVV